MHTFRQIVFSTIGLMFLSSFANAQVDLNALLDDPKFYAPDLSPEGNFIAGIRRDDGAENLLMVDLNTGEAGFVGVDGAEINWVQWVTEDRFLMSVTSYFNQLGKRVTFKELNTDASVRAFGVTRLVSMNRDGSKYRVLFDNQQKFRGNFNLANVTDFLEDDPKHVLMPARVKEELDLFRVNILTGKYKRVANGREGTIAWFTDSNGEPAFRVDTNKRASRLYYYAREVKDNGKYTWRKTRTIDLTQRREDEEEQALFRPIAPGQQPDTYIVVARPEGEDRSGIYLYNFEKDEYLEALATHPTLDITNAFFDKKDGTLIGYSYWEDRITYKFLTQHARLILTA